MYTIRSFDQQLKSSIVILSINAANDIINANVFYNNIQLLREIEMSLCNARCYVTRVLILRALFCTLFEYFSIAQAHVRSSR